MVDWDIEIILVEIVYNLWVELIGFGGLGMESEGMGEIEDDFCGFGLRRWMDDGVIYWGKDLWKIRFLEKDEEFCFGRVLFKMVVR